MVHRTDGALVVKITVSGGGGGVDWGERESVTAWMEWCVVSWSILSCNTIGRSLSSSRTLCEIPWTVQDLPALTLELDDRVWK